MAEKIPVEDQTRAPKSRPRPEVRRPVAPPPGGLPLPPSRQHTVPSSRFLPESGASSIPAASAVSPDSGTRSIPTDLFGLPDFKFPIAPTRFKTSVEKSRAGFSSMKSPKHLPRIASLMVPSLLGSLPASSGGSKLSKKIGFPKQPDFKSVVDPKSRDESVTNTLAAKQAQRPSDISLLKPDASVTKHSSDPVSIDKSQVLELKVPSTSKDFKSVSTIGKASDVASTSAQRVESSAAEKSEPHFSESSVISLPQGASASVQLPESSANVASSELQDFNLVAKRSSDPTPTMPEAEPFSEIRRSGESMPVIAQHPDLRTKSKEIFGKVKRFVSRRLGVKKAGKDDEESTGLVFEKDETEQERRSETRPSEKDKKYKKFPTDTYNYFLAIDPILPKGEVESQCRMIFDAPCDSPSESVVSGTSTPKSESLVTSPESSYVEESTSKSHTVSPAPDDAEVLESTPSPSVERPAPGSRPVSPAMEQTSEK